MQTRNQDARGIIQIDAQNRPGGEEGEEDTWMSVLEGSKKRVT
jgi:hypothetical protein